ncbi:MAG: hypothetical protein WC700_07570 [Gemmatimonadaceae bacterium]|jgi:hypothetical protein
MHVAITQAGENYEDYTTDIGQLLSVVGGRVMSIDDIVAEFRSTEQIEGVDPETVEQHRRLAKRPLDIVITALRSGLLATTREP